MGKLIRLGFGWLFVALGVVGLVMPVLQGWLLIGIGSMLLAPEVPFFARLVTRVERRSPRIRRFLAGLRRRLGHRPGESRS
jgi:uncharacterized membrane protein YbaN (DUF454 family)